MTSYCAVADLRNQLQDSGNRFDATQLQTKIDVASRDVEDHCARRFDLDPVASTRVYPVASVRVYDEAGCAKLLVDDIGSAAGLVVESSADGSTWTTVAASGYELRPLNAPSTDPNAYAWWWLAEAPAASSTWAWARRIRITARWGWSAIPSKVAEATLLRATGLWKRRDSPMGVGGGTDFGYYRIRQDPDVEALLARYVRPEGIA